jgi:hypothetical protein
VRQAEQRRLQLAEQQRLAATSSPASSASPPAESGGTCQIEQESWTTAVHPTQGEARAALDSVIADRVKPNWGWRVNGSVEVFAARRLNGAIYGYYAKVPYEREICYGRATRARRQ